MVAGTSPAAAGEEEAYVALPVLDLGLLEEEGGPARLAAQAGQALEEVGFFFLKNHGVPVEFIEGMFAAVARFHALPLEAKLSIALNEHKKGYVPLGGHLRPAAYSKPSGNAALHMRFPDTASQQNQFPPEETGFRALAQEYVGRVDALAHRLLPLLAGALGLPPGFFDEAFAGAQCSFSVAHYPDGPAPRIGIAAHTDSGVLTLLGQSDKPGLELCLTDGRWVRPQPMPGAILVNSGDLLRRWTNHRWLSTLHRVVNIPGQERYAIPLFWNPRADYLMEALPGCSSARNPARYGPVTFTAYMEGWYAGEYSSLRSLTPAQIRAAQEGVGEEDSSGVLPGASGSRL